MLEHEEMSMVCKLQSRSAEFPMLVHLLRLYTTRSYSHMAKHPIGRDAPGYILMLVNPLQESNAYYPMVNAFEMSVFLNI